MNKKNSLVLILIAIIILSFFLVKNSFRDLFSSRESPENNIRKITMEIRQKAENGNIQAQSDLGLLYEQGNDVEKDYAKAFYWYKKSAMHGYDVAQYNVGSAYENGRGVQRDLQKAIEWYSKSAEQGNTKSQVNLGMLYLDDMGVVRDYDKARHWFLLAASNNDTIAMNNLGYMYRSGLGIPKDDSEAIKWYQKSANLGSMKARNMLALYYTQEIGNFPEDIQKARELLKASACQGYAIAQNNLGILYSNSPVSSRENYLLAYAWFATASANGLKEARGNQDKIAINMSSQEIDKAQKLASEFVEKYHSPVVEDDTYKSKSECKHP